MKNLILCFFGLLFLYVCITGCDGPFLEGRRPINYPNTRWVSQDPDIYFIIGDELGVNGRGFSYAEVTYAQIVHNGKVFELKVGFTETGATVVFDDASGYESGTDRLLFGLNNSDVRLFTGLCRFSSNRLVVTISNNDKGFLDDSITEIIFIREDIE